MEMVDNFCKFLYMYIV